MRGETEGERVWGEREREKHYFVVQSIMNSLLVFFLVCALTRG